MTQRHRSFWVTPQGLAALGLIAAAAYFLFIEHRQHVWQFFPYLVLLACPFMHLIMHGGHGHDGHGDLGQHSNEPDQDAYQRELENGRKGDGHRRHH